MKKSKLFLTFLLFCGFILLMSGCETETVDYEAILDASLEEVKIPGVATTANRDFTVPLELKVTYEEKEYTIVLSWVSSKTNVISLDGANATVTRPDAGDADVVLTCTLTLEGKVREKKFELSVYEKELTPADILNAAEVDLRAKIDDLNVDNITEKVILPNLAGLASVSWSSDNISAITSTGDVTRPAYGDGNASVKMVATLTSGAEKKEIEFTFTVLENARPADSEIPQLAANYLTIKTNDVVEDLELTTSGRFETTITWVSSNPDVVSNDGVVTRPKASTGSSVTVLLTATISYNDFFVTKNFSVNVLELEPSDNQEKAEVAFHNLGIDYVVVTETALELPLTSSFDTTFVYTANNDNVTINGGSLTIVRLTSDYVVEIKATTTIDSVVYEFYFAFVVKSTSKGSGTIEDPFVIETAADLAKVGTGNDGWDLESHYVLYSDIDLSEVCSESLGTWNPIGNRTTPFKGTFNGNGHTISNLYVKLGENNEVGLFGGIYKATVSNLYLNDSYVEGNMRVGTLVGYASSSIVRNVFVENTNVLALVGGDCHAGGLIGLAEVTLPSEETMVVENCAVIDGVVTGQYHVGGLIGRAMNNPIDDNDKAYHLFVKNVYAKVTVYANRRQGGLIGSFTGKLENAIVDAVLKAHPNPSNTQNISALLIGAIEYKTGPSPMTSISNVVFGGNMQDIIDLATGRTSTLTAFKSITDDYITLENIYMTCAPYSKNGTSDYNEGENGVQITMENAKSAAWYYSTLKSLDLENIWAIEEGNLPTLRYQKDNSSYEVAMRVFLDLPGETIDNLNLITNTYLNNIVVNWESNNIAIGADGVIVRPSYLDGDVTVKLTANYIINGKEYSKEFDVVVKAEDPTEDEMFNTVKDEIELVLSVGVVEDNLTLLTNGSFDAQISWVSDNLAISSDGTVVRPDAGSEDAVVKLTATVEINGVQRQFDYNLVVKAWPSSELALNNVYDSLVLETVVTEDLVFDTSRVSNSLTVNIIWESNHSAISSAGVVSRPTYLEGDALVTVTASLTCGEFSKEKVFEITVKALDATDEEMVIEAKTAISNALVESLVNDIELPTLKENVSATYLFTVGSVYLSLVDNKIVVIRPSYETGDVDYLLEVSIAYQTASDTLTFSGKILKSMGDGSEENPFIIDSLELLEKIGSDNFTLKSCYILKADLDMSEKYNSTSEISWKPITNFNGTFDGGNKTIFNLYINNSSLNYQGLFGRLTSGVVIRNLNLVNADITAKQNTGIIGGQINTNSTALIENVNVSGSVTCINGTGDTINGGLFGAVDGRTDDGKTSNIIIRNCKVDVDVVGCQNVGGAFGIVKINKATNSILISNIEVRGTVKGNQKLGGFVGQVERNNSGTAIGSEEYLTIKNAVTYSLVSFNDSNDKNPSGCGGFVGQLSDGSTDILVKFENCIVYNPIDVATFAAITGIGWYASFCGRLPKELGVTVASGYVNCEPYGYNGVNESTTGNIWGSKLEEEHLLSFSWYTDSLGFSSDLWKIGTEGIELI